MLKISSDATANILQNLLYEFLESRTFPDSLTIAEITPAMKNEYPLDMANYLPVSVLPTASKLFEKIVQKQVNGFKSNCLLPYLCGHRKGYYTQWALSVLIEKKKNNLDNKGCGGAVLMALSKAFDTWNHDLLIVKFSGYGLEYDTRKLIYSYIINR